MGQTIKLDTRKREDKYGEARIAPLRRGERNNVLLTVKVCANGAPYDLVGKTASLVATTAAGKLVGPCPMEVAEAGIARIMLSAALYSAVGAFSGYIEIREGETLVDTTDSFGGKVIECADLDAEQAAEFTPLLGELQNAVAEEAKRVEAEKARVQAETERATGFAEAKQAAQAATEAANDAAADANLAAGTASDAAKSANTAAGKATNAAAKAESDVRAFVNAAGTAIGDAIAAAREDVDAAVKRSDAATAKAEAAVKTADAANTAATQAVSDARDAIAEVKATEAKLYPAAENILVGSETGAVAHADDAFAGASLRKITVEGATEQVTTTGKNLLDCYKLAEIASKYYAVENGNLKVIQSNNNAWSAVPAFITLDAGTYYSSGDKSLEIRKASDDSTVRYGEGRFVLDQNTEIKIKVGTGLPSYPVVINAQIEKGSTATAYEPYTGGKPSPSPDFPQEIKVIENPTIQARGRNLWPFASSCTSIEGRQNEFVKEGTPFTLLPGVYAFSAAGSLGNTDAPLFGYTSAGKRFQFFRILHNVQNPKYSFTVTEPITTIYFVANAAVSNTGTISNIQLERNSAATGYAPHTSQTLAFTLPAEHPYLAKLPNGTADEIVVDREGNVELVARVSKVIPKDIDTLKFGAGTDTDAPYVSFLVGGIASKTGILCNSYQTSTWTNKSGYIYCPNGSDIVIRDARFTSEEQAKELLDGVVVYVAVQETRYPLGKIEVPKAQDSIINVWTDAEITPRTGIEYVRDVNIVVSNLESAIASITEG